MNVFSIIGLLISISVLLIGLRLASEDLSMFLDYPSLFIVMGGTFAATALSFNLNRIFFLVKIFVKRIFFGKQFKYADVIKEMMRITESYRKGESLDSILSTIKDPFLRECIELLNEGILEKDHFLEVCENRAEKMMVNYSEEGRKIKAIGKFPPAFGMMGTTIGMIVLLANLGGEDALKKIGPAMGVCLITTLYGVAFANLIIVPVSENLMDNSKEVYLKNQIVVEGLRLFVDKTNPIVVGIELNSFLTPSERVDWKEATRG